MAEKEKNTSDIPEQEDLKNLSFESIGIGLLFTNSWSFFVKNFTLLFTIQLLAILPTIVLQLRNLNALNNFDNNFETTVADGEIWPFLKGFLMAFFDPINVMLIVAAIVLSLLGTLALYRAIIEIDTGKDLEVLDAYRKGAKYVSAYFGATILSSLIVGLGVLMIVVPGIIFSIWFLFYGFAITYEGKGAVDSLKRSRELVRGFFWPVLGRDILLGLIVGAVMGIFSVFSFLPYFGIVAQGIAQAAGSVFIVIYLYHFYKGLRVIKG